MQFENRASILGIALTLGIHSWSACAFELDSNFGVDGKIQLLPSTSWGLVPDAPVSAPDGSIFLAGTYNDADDHNHVGVWKFGGDGRVSTDFQIDPALYGVVGVGVYGGSASLGFTRDNKIMLAFNGPRFQNSEGGTVNVCQLNSETGRLVGRFATSGCTGLFRVYNKVVFGSQSSGAAIIAYSKPGGWELEVTRVSPEGGVDQNFLRTSFGGDISWNSQSLAVDSHDRVYICGYYVAGEKIVDAVLRLTANGDIDQSFGTAGLIQFPSYGIFSSEGLTSFRVAADDSLVATGVYKGENRDTLYRTFRLNQDGLPILTYGVNGVADVDFGAPMTVSFRSGDAVLLRDGRVIYTTYGPYEDGTIWASLDTLGHIDSTIVAGGHMRTPLLDTDTLSVSADGNILAVQTDLAGAPFLCRYRLQ